jgi:hypothetical protein
MLSATSLASIKQLSGELEIKSLIEIFEETREQFKWHFPAYRFSEVEGIDFYWGFYLGEQLYCDQGKCFDRFFMSTFPMNHEPYMTNVMVRS